MIIWSYLKLRSTTETIGAVWLSLNNSEKILQGIQAFLTQTTQAFFPQCLPNPVEAAAAEPNSRGPLYREMLVYYKAGRDRVTCPNMFNGAIVALPVAAPRATHAKPSLRNLKILSQRKN